MDHFVMFHKNHVCIFIWFITEYINIYNSGIFSSTIKNNIIFGQEYDHKLFQRVAQAAALETVSPSKSYTYYLMIIFVFPSQDFLQLPHGANTMVGDQGVMLSGVRQQHHSVSLIQLN